MSRLFGGVNTDRLLAATAAGINNLNPFSVGVMLYPASLVSSKYFVAKYDLAGAAGWLFLMNATDKPAMLVKRATTDVTYSGNTALTINTWWSVVVTVDLGASPTTHIYQAAVGSDMAEPTYSVSTDGSGAQKDDSAGNFAIGNGSWVGATSAQQGLFANVFVVDKVLTLQDAQEYHKGRAPLAYRPLIHFPIWGQGSPEPDYSRTQLSGTVDGTVGPADHPPQARWRPSIIRAGIPSAGAAVFASRVVTRRHRRK